MEAVASGCGLNWFLTWIRRNWSYLLIPKGVWDGERLTLGNLGLVSPSAIPAPAALASPANGIWGIPGDGDAWMRPQQWEKGVCSKSLCRNPGVQGERVRRGNGIQGHLHALPAAREPETGWGIPREMLQRTQVPFPTPFAPPVSLSKCFGCFGRGFILRLKRTWSFPKHLV